MTLDYGMPRYLIYAEGQFGTPASKTGHSVIRRLMVATRGLNTRAHPRPALESEVTMGTSRPSKESIMRIQERAGHSTREVHELQIEGVT